MTEPDRMIPVPESALREALRVLGRTVPEVLDEVNAYHTLVACLPEPTFTDDEALAFYRALWSAIISPDDLAIEDGRRQLTRLAKAVAEGKWTAPKALCPPPSPALVEVVEAARRVAKTCVVSSSYLLADALRDLRAAVAAYDGQEG